MSSLALSGYRARPLQPNGRGAGTKTDCTSGVFTLQGLPAGQVDWRIAPQEQVVPIAPIKASKKTGLVQPSCEKL
jgi:hypothetical protein